MAEKPKYLKWLVILSLIIFIMWLLFGDIVLNIAIGCALLIGILVSISRIEKKSKYSLEGEYTPRESAREEPTYGLTSKGNGESYYKENTMKRESERIHGLIWGQPKKQYENDEEYFNDKRNWARSKISGGRDLRTDETERFGEIRRTRQHKRPYEHMMNEGKNWVRGKI